MLADYPFRGWLNNKRNESSYISGNSAKITAGTTNEDYSPFWYLNSSKRFYFETSKNFKTSGNISCSGP